MSEGKEVTVEVTPEDMEFRARAKAAGLPDVLISVYGTALRRLVADERERIASEWDGRMYGDTEDIDIGAAIRARKP